jgi:hypothetical protein
MHTKILLTLILPLATMVGATPVQSQLADEIAIRDPAKPPRGVPDEARAAWAPLGLPRLIESQNSGMPSTRLSPDKYQVDPLILSEDAAHARDQRLTERSGVRVLQLAPGARWSSTSRVPESTLTAYLSFRLYASTGTRVMFQGTTLAVDNGPIAGSLALFREDTIRDETVKHPLGLHVALDYYDGLELAALPVITLRCDLTHGTWDLFVSTRQVADNLLISSPATATGNVTILAGDQGAWLVGLVLADENPLFEDENRSGIDDSFERQQLDGRLLTAESSWLTRRRVATSWRQHQLAGQNRPLLVEPLQSDRMDALLTPESKE